MLRGKFELQLHFWVPLEVQIFRAIGLQSDPCYVRSRTLDKQKAVSNFIMQVAILLFHRKNTLQSVRMPKGVIRFIIYLAHVGVQVEVFP